MKKICILVIASRSKDINEVTRYQRYGLYDLYVKLFWIPIIEKLKYIKHIDCFLLYNSEKEVKGWDIYELYLKDNVLFEDYLGKDIISMIPGILSKQLNAFKLLKNTYDVFWNCNLSSIPEIERLDKYIQLYNINYSGHYVFNEKVSTHLRMYRNDSEVTSLLKEWPGRTFLGGSGFFLNKDEVTYIVGLLDNIKLGDIFYIVNDLAIGLLMPNKSINEYFLNNSGQGTKRVCITNSMTYNEYNKLLQLYISDKNILDIRFENVQREDILRKVSQMLYRCTI
tara:strand:+ start:478 stop:1323 length:846 start_codon:yes stop_codon:yes gene_type:complete